MLIDPIPGGIVIEVWNCRATVSRWARLPNDDLILEPATNADDLEAEAHQAVLDQGGGVNLSGMYECPDDLATRAVWPGEPA